jgi:hypothetical protein
MRIYKTKVFNRIATKDIEISDEALKIAVKEMNSGLFDANLGGNIYKKRVALDGRGKSSGARTILCFKAGEKVLFMYAFAKNDRDNISDIEEKVYKKLAVSFFGFNDKDINKLIKDGELVEVK